MKLFVICVLSALLASSQEAPTVLAPPKSADALESELHPFPQDILRDYLKSEYPTRVFREFEGKNDALLKEAEEGGGALPVAEGYVVGLDAHELCGKPLLEGETHIWLMGIRSAGAEALRLEVDLSGLEPEETLWVIDPALPRAFGPFTAVDQSANTLWLPTVDGDTAVLMIRSELDSVPPMRLERISHFFRPLQATTEKCPINVLCEADAGIRAAATAVGRLHVTLNSGTTLLCSGSLLEAPQTPEQEPYFISAHHCFDRPLREGDIEVIWDYQTEACDGVAAPPLSSLPRSLGGVILVNDRLLDFTFLRLNHVPGGAEGRAWLGWTAAAAGVGQDVLGIHHPQGNSKKLCYGNVTDTGVSGSFYASQNEIHWDQGITEQGSSGSPALYRDSLKLMGVLSNGAVHRCDTPSQNVDNYGSFSAFFPQIACYLTENSECKEAPELTCPAKAAYGENGENIMALRNFRDQVLAKSAWGRGVIAEYYREAPRLAAVVSASQEARALFGAAALPVILFERLRD